jgi:hypothetical protein
MRWFNRNFCLFFVLVFCAYALFLPDPGYARILAGHTATVDYQTAHPYFTRTPGIVWSQTISYPGATWIKLHFSDFQFDRRDTVKILDELGNVVQQLTGDYTAEPQLWSKTIPGEEVTVELHASGLGNGYGFKIDALGHGLSEAELEERGIYPSICPGSQLWDIGCPVVLPHMFAAGEAVARLSFKDINGDWYWGTGWLADFTPFGGNDLHGMLTAKHNLFDPAGDTEYLEAQFDALTAPPCSQPPEPGGNIRAAPTCDYDQYIACNWIAPDPVCDWGIVFLQRAPGLFYGALSLLNADPDSGDIYIPGHPAGRCKEVAWAIADNVVDECEFGHWVSTTRGSSGSPVLGKSPIQDKAVGVHVKGGCPANPNQATRMTRIIPFLQAITPDQWEEYCLCDEDFGDAPDPPYPSLLASNGARHLISEEWMGIRVDGEPDSKQIDLDQFDDGLVFLPPYRPCQVGQVEVTLSVAKPESERYEGPKNIVLNAWADWINNGNWTDLYTCFVPNDANDHIIWIAAAGPGVEPGSLPSTALWINPEEWSTNTEVFTLSFLAPPVVANTIWWRFRLEYYFGMDINGSLLGPSDAGEVEDYVIQQGEPCDLIQDVGVVNYYFGGWAAGDAIAKYFDPEVYCEEPVYPYKIHDVEFILYDFAEMGSVDIIIDVHIVCLDSCDGPGTRIYQSDPITITDFYPNMAHVDLPEQVCVYEPFFISLEYATGVQGSTPSFVWPDETYPCDSCHVWMYHASGGYPFWIEWNDFWSPPAGGCPIIRVTGFTEHPDCEQEPCDTTLDTMWGATYPYYYWRNPSRHGHRYFNERFDMPVAGAGGRLDEIHIRFYGAGEGCSGTPDPEIYVWLSDGLYPIDNNPPYQAIAQFNIAYEDIVWYSGWNLISTYEMGMMFDAGESFHVGYGHAYIDGDTLCTLSDDGYYNSDRSVEWALPGQWGTILDDWGIGVDFMINAVICPNELAESTFTITCSPFLNYATPGDPPMVKYEVDVGSVLGYNLNVDLSCTPPDPGVTVSFNPNGIPTPYTSDVTVTVDYSVTYGDYTLIFCGTGQDGQGPKCCDVTLRVQAPSCGDCNGDTVVNIADVSYLINYLFIGGPAPDPLCLGDVNCDTLVNIADVCYLINYLFVEGPPPCLECCDLKAKMQKFPGEKIERVLPQKKEKLPAQRIERNLLKKNCSPETSQSPRRFEAD